MTNQDIQFHRQDQQSLANMKMAIWALTLVVLVPGVGSLIYLGVQMQRVEQNETRSVENQIAIRNLEMGSAAIHENLKGIKESVNRTERMLEQLLTERRE